MERMAEMGQHEWARVCLERSRECLEKPQI
jgi:hypothetical protein